MEHGDEIYSLCQVPPVVKPAAVQDKPPSPPVPQLAVKKSPTPKIIKQKCLVDSTTFLLPAGNGPVYLDEKNKSAKVHLKVVPAAIPIPVAVTTPTTIKSSTANVFKKKQTCSESPTATTAKIFAPRTEDMNKGFLTFSDDDTGLTSESFVLIFMNKKIVFHRFVFLYV